MSAEATVEDVNRKAWTASVSVVVHPSALCVGLRSHHSFVTGGRPFEIETVVVDLDGAVLPGIPVSVRAERREHRQVAGQWREVVAETVERTAVSGTDAVGVALDGVVRTEPLHVTDAFHTLRIPVEDAFTPGVDVHVVLAGAGARPDATAGVTRPAFASGSVHLPVPPVARTLAVAITPRAPGLRPGEETVLDLAVHGADGAPVAGAGATVIVVDEAVLAVAAYTNPDPLGVSYPQRGAGVETTRSRPRVLLARPDALAESGEVEPEGDVGAMMCSSMRLAGSVSGTTAGPLVVEPAVVRSREPARRPGRGFRVAAVGGLVPVSLHRPCDDPGHLHRRPAQSRGNVLARSVRPRRHRPGDHRVATRPKVFQNQLRKCNANAVNTGLPFTRILATNEAGQ